MTSFRVLMVCTANHCRSPIAEQLLTTAAAARFGAADNWIVESAGTAAYTVRSIHPHAETVLTQRHAYMPGHRSRLLDVSMLRGADLVLTAARDQRSAVVQLLPAAIGRTFTMRQFARLADKVPILTGPDPAELGRQLVVEAKAARPLMQPAAPGEDDLADPMGGPLEAFQQCAAQLEVMVRSWLNPLQISMRAGDTA